MDVLEISFVQNTQPAQQNNKRRKLREGEGVEGTWIGEEYPSG